MAAAHNTTALRTRTGFTLLSHLGALRVRRAVCAQEEPGAAAHRSAQHRLPVALALQDGQAECMRPQSTLQQANKLM